MRNFFSNEHAQGGHIDAYAEGGNIQSHSVPGTYTGIVGEAGPEIFSVNRGNVTITPLNSREKCEVLKVYFKITQAVKFKRWRCC